MNTKSFTVAGVNYNVESDGVMFTIAQEGQAPMWMHAIDQTKTPAEAMQEVVAIANTFLVGQFPSAQAQFVAAFLALFDTMVITVTAGVPVITIP